ARAVAGPADLCARFEEAIAPVRYPVVLDDGALRHMRTLKARMENERLPRGTDPRRHLKLGPGGLSDVEWSVQILPLRHGHAHATLRTTRTLEAIVAAERLGLLERADAH